MMTDGYQKAIDALQLNGLCPRSQEAYVRAVRMLVEFTGKTPDDISEPELQQYFLHRKNQRIAGLPTPCGLLAVSATSSSMCCAGIGTPSS
jgi:hypothetical protein